MRDDEIEVKLDGPPGATDPRAVAEAINALDKLLRNIEGDETPSLRLSSLSMGSAVVSVRADRQRVALVRSGLDALASSTDVPPGWNADSISALIELESVSRRHGVEAVMLTANEVVASIDRTLASRAQASIAPSPPALGAVRGKLYRYNGDRRVAGMRDERTGQIVDVNFPAHLASDVRSALDCEVEVWGEVHRDTYDRIRSISAVGLDVFSSSREAVTLDHVAGILGRDWTGGLDAVDWVRRQRD